jgi:hypothetical protein
MAAPIGHIYLALQLLNGPLKGVNHQDFLIGTSFPDIRYLAHIPREKTHYQHVDLQRILTEREPFKQGMLFHSFVDQERERFMKENQINNLLPSLPHKSGILKGLEDQLLHPKLPDKSFLRLFDTVIDQELKIVTHKIIIQEWHTNLQNYFFYGPTPQTIRPFVQQSIPHMGPLQTIAEQTVSYGFFVGTKVITLNQEVIKIINKFYDSFYTEVIEKTLNLLTSSHA